MRESQYIGQYLGVTDSGTLWTPGTFLAYRLRGKAKQYAPNYERALWRAINRRLRAGDIEEVRSVRGGKAFRTKG